MRPSTPARLTSLLLLLSACRSAPEPVPLETWGGMREALREGRSEARVALAEVAVPGTYGVGALAGLEGEITIVDGRALVARVSEGACGVTEAAPGDQATLLVVARVPRWRELPLADCDGYAELEAQVAAQLERAGIDPRQPTPLLVRGRAPSIDYHVIAGSCPIANPDGPAPWRYHGPLDRVELVGVHAEGAAGTLTHHTHRSHLHVVAEGRTGHLDEVVLRDAILLLPD